MPVDDIALGDRVTVEVTKQPTSDAARKTLVRVLSKDAEVATENERLRRTRASNEYANQRGGRVRVWAGRQVKLRPVSGQVGEKGTITATYDVVNDLKSVERFVSVAKA